MDSIRPDKPTFPRPTFEPGRVLTAEQLNRLVEYDRWLERRIDELEEWSKKVQSKEQRKPDTLFLRPGTFIVPPGPTEVSAGIPFRIYGRFPDRTEEDLTSECECFGTEDRSVAVHDGAAPNFRL